MRIVDVHLAAVGFDVELALSFIRPVASGLARPKLFHYLDEILMTERRPAASSLSAFCGQMGTAAAAQPARCARPAGRRARPRPSGCGSTVSSVRASALRSVVAVVGDRLAPGDRRRRPRRCARCRRCAAPGPSCRTRRRAGAAGARAGCPAGSHRRSTAAGSRPRARARPAASASRAAPISAVRNGSTRLPSPAVPSPNSSTGSPSARRCAISAFTAPVLWRRSRSTNTERCSLASRPKNGQRAISLLATNTTGASAVMIEMSSQEE